MLELLRTPQVEKVLSVGRRSVRIDDYPLTEVAHSMLACTRDGYPHYAINPRDITKLAKQL